MIRSVLKQKLAVRLKTTLRRLELMKRPNSKLDKRIGREMKSKSKS